MTKLKTTPYSLYEGNLPQHGQHIVGQLRGANIIVYQAFNPNISRYAVEFQRFGGSHYSFRRMSWIKPNFLWMMYRAGWASKEHQQKILAIEIPLTHFYEILKEATHSTYKEAIYGSNERWKAAMAKSEVRLQWDPDHNPYGDKLERRAIQLGLKGKFLKRFGTEQVVAIEDITPFVHQQYALLKAGKMDELEVIEEQVITIDDEDIRQNLQLDS